MASLGDDRGFEALRAILKDKSYRPEGQGVGRSSDGRYSVDRQIAADHYYAAHLLGDLKDPRAVPILIPLLQDEAIKDIAPWALGEIQFQFAEGEAGRESRSLWAVSNIGQTLCTKFSV